MKLNKNFNLDQEDKLLLYIALGITILIFLYHIFYTHYILMFAYRLSIILQQLTILFILAKLTLSQIRVMKAFTYTLVAELALVFVIVIVTIFKGNEDFLFESSRLWYGISALTFVISVISFLVGFRLIQRDPRFKSYNLKWNAPFKHQKHASLNSQQVGYWLDISEDSLMVIDEHRNSIDKKGQRLESGQSTP
mmetsp:Transcript_30765/g.22863  ORF Transcript_30765/g.22863 Transcript_30765/m.22863 type:complete len:194 (+) Transcript_30765:171-752(+)